MNYLAYGSNLHPLRLERRVGCCRLLGVRPLRGLRLAFCKRGQDGSGKCTLIDTGRDEDWVHGALFELPAGARAMLDRCEGLGRGYGERRLRLADGTSAFCYQADDDALEPGLRPYDWYVALVLAGARFHGFPPAYCRWLAGVAAVADPDAGRTRRQRELLEAIEAQGGLRAARGMD